MTLKIELFFSAAWYDVSDYILNATDIPIIATNEDYSLNGEGFSFDISDLYNNTHIEFALWCRFSIDGDSYFQGFITSRTKMEGKHSYKIRCENILTNLKNFKIDYDTLHNALVANKSGDIDYVLADNFGSPNVRLIYLIEEIFAAGFIATGLTLDTSDFDTSQVIFLKEIVPTPGNPEDISFNFDDLRIDENMLYAINQQVAISHTKIDDVDEFYRNNKITFWDFIDQICSMFSLFIFYKNGVFYMERIKTDETYTISDDTTYGKRTKIKVAKDAEYKIEQRANLDRSTYQSGSPSDLTTTFEDGTASDSNVSWYNNLVILFQIVAGADSDVYSLVLDNYVYATDVDSAGFEIMGRAKAVVTNESTTLEQVTEIDATRKQVINNYVDVAEKLSTIKSGGYL